MHQKGSFKGINNENQDILLSKSKSLLRRKGFFLRKIKQQYLFPLGVQFNCGLCISKGFAKLNQLQKCRSAVAGPQWNIKMKGNVSVQQSYNVTWESSAKTACSLKIVIVYYYYLLFMNNLPCLHEHPYIPVSKRNNINI